MKFSEFHEYVLADEPDGEISFWLSPDADEGQAEPLVFGASFGGKVFFERLDQDSVGQKRRQTDVTAEPGQGYASLPQMRPDDTDVANERQALRGVKHEAFAYEAQDSETHRSMIGGPNLLSDAEPTDPGLLFFIRNYDCKTNDPKDRFRCAGCQEDYLILRQEIIHSLTDEQIAEINNNWLRQRDAAAKYES